MDNFKFPSKIEDHQKISVASGLVKHPNEYQGIFMFAQKKEIGGTHNCYNFDSTMQKKVGLAGFGEDAGSIRMNYDSFVGINAASKILFVGEQGVIFWASLPADAEEKLLSFEYEPICAARTLQELIKLITEYADAPGNIRIQIVARSLLYNLDITDEIKTILYETTPPGPVMKYIQGRTDARFRDIPDSRKGYIDERIDHWLWYEFISGEKYREFGYR